MVFDRLSEKKYTRPSCALICLDSEADICNGTNQAGHDYGDNPMDDLDD